MEGEGLARPGHRGRGSPAGATATAQIGSARDFGEGRIGHAASDWDVVSFDAFTPRGTSAGHVAASGQLAENHDMIASYFRAVKDAPSSKRSKNRQSPVARRATVDGSRLVAFANSLAQVRR